MPSRIIKESIGSSETLASITDAEERHFWRIVVQADDFGRLDARPHVIRAKAYSAMLTQVGEEESERRTQALVKAGLMSLYESGDKRYGAITTWSSHQRGRAAISKFPEPPLLTDVVARQQPPTDDNTKQQPSASCAHTRVVSESVSVIESVSESGSRSRGLSGGGENEEPDGSSPNNNHNSVTPERFLKTLVKEYEANIAPVTPSLRTQMTKFAGEYAPAECWITDAVEEAVAADVKQWRYIKKILEEWCENGRNGEQLSRGPPRRGGSTDPQEYERRYGHLARARETPKES